MSGEASVGALEQGLDIQHRPEGNESIAARHPVKPILGRRGQGRLHEPAALPWRRGQDRREATRAPLEDESNNLSAIILEPQLDPDNELYNTTKDTLSYLCRTKGVEIGTERTGILQKAVDEMIAKGGKNGEPLRTNSGKDIKARVVIMNKGEEENAFVIPDGTIFVSQSLLNRLVDSQGQVIADEVDGVLAHELGHIRDETAILKTRAGEESKAKQFGVCWAHETSADIGARDLLEAIGRNSLGLDDAILKISENSRGSIHQTGLSRASQGVGQHLVLDSTTSAKEKTLYPSIFRRNVEPSHENIVTAAIARKDVETIRSVLPMLHPDDLSDGYNFAKKQTNYMWDKDRLREVDATKKQSQLLEAFNKFFIQKFEQEGYSQAEINTFFLLSYQKSETVNLSMITSPEMFVSAVRNLPDFQRGRKFDAMEKLLFGDTRPPVSELQTKTFFESVKNHISTGALSVEKDVFIQMLETANSWEDSDLWGSNHGERKKDLLTAVVGEYILKTCVISMSEKEFFDRAIPGKTILLKNKTKSLLSLIKAKGIILDIDDLKHMVVRNYSGDSDISEKRVASAIHAVFPQEQGLQEEERELDQEIDSFLSDLSNGSVIGISDDLEGIRNQLDKVSATDAQRMQYLEHIEAAVKSMDIWTFFDPDMHAEFGIPEYIDTTGLNRKIFIFSVQSAAAMMLFPKDSPDFYAYMTKLMEESEIPIENMSQKGLYTICANFLSPTTKYIEVFQGQKFPSKAWNVEERPFVTIEQYNRYLKLPFLQRLMGESEQQLTNATMQELNEYYESTTKTQFGIKQSVFDEGFASVVFLRPMRERFIQLVQSGLPQEDFDAFYQFIDTHFPSSPQKNVLLRNIRTKYLDEPIRDRVDLERKITYLDNNFDTIGVPGMIALAEHIMTLDDYLYFRERMGGRIVEGLEGSTDLSKVALADFLSSITTDALDSFGVKSYEGLFSTMFSDAKSKKLVSTNFAQAWHEALSPDYAHDKLTIETEEKTDKLILGGSGKDGFRTFKDVVDTLQELSPTERFAIVHKLLADTKGALTEPWDRNRLGQIALHSLDIQSPFIRDVLFMMCTRGPKKFLTYPIGMMLGPLLFRALDIDAVNIAKVSKAKSHFGSKYTAPFPAKILPDVISSTTHDIVRFGPQYRGVQSSEVAVLADQSSQQYDEAFALVEQLVGNGSKRESKDVQVSDLPANIEGIISAVEGSGPLGKRILQLARQLYAFSPEIDRRLADSFDATPGLNKLSFWENIVRDMEKNTDPAQAQFIRERLVTVDKVIAGGSQNTVVKGTIRGEDGREESSASVYRNPNAELFIKTAYEMAQDILTIEAQYGKHPESRKFARMGLTLIDLAHQWSLRDINDPTYEVDDDIFRGTIEAYSAMNTDDAIHFVAPDRKFTGDKLRVEEFVEGQTVNKWLNDEAVPIERKREVIGRIRDFFAFQMSDEAVKNSEGQYLIHSDPHVGNFMIGEDGDLTAINVIDRHMYLKISDAEAKMFHTLLRTGDYQAFLDPFIDNLFVRNKEQINADNHAEIRARIKRGIKGQYLKQRVKNFGREVDNFSLMRLLLTECTDAGLDIPLEHRLMIRNVEMFRNLEQKYATTPAGR